METALAQEKKKQDIMEKRFQILQNPQSIVIVPKTREGHILVRLAFGLDRVVSRIRFRAGTYININEVVNSLRQVNEFIKEFNQFITYFESDGGMMGGAFLEGIETKKMLASLKSSHIILPRSNEGKEMILLIKRFDPALVQFRNACTDFSKAEDIFKKLVDLIERFYLLIRELSNKFEIPFQEPKDYNSLRSIHNGKLGEARGAENQEENSRKGRKSGGVA